MGIVIKMFQAVRIHRHVLETFAALLEQMIKQWSLILLEITTYIKRVLGSRHVQRRAALVGLGDRLRNILC